MNRNRCKELLPIMQAFAEGKTIQCKDVEDDDWKDIKYPTFNDAYVNYRIKPEEEYRPYKDCEEMIDDYKVKHNIVNNEDVMPLIWVKHKQTGKRQLLTSFGKTNVDMSDVNGTFIKELYKDYEYLDGSPIGVKN